MAEGMTFWLDNKHASGTKAAQIGDQVLVTYRDRFYVIVNDAALMKGGKPLRYSQTSLPAVWKKALRGESHSADVSTTAELDLPAKPTVPRKAPVKHKNEVSVMPEPTPVAPAPIATAVQPKPPVLKASKAASKTEGKQAAQSVVTAECPYCSQKQEIPVEKGRSGKPFFHSCAKCKSDFAVRFVQVTVYQAQVAGFR
jgi:hypothetical protein